jgi:transcriptional regulator with GAF, ATPase, and Fis domain
MPFLSKDGDRMQNLLKFFQRLLWRSRRVQKPTNLLYWRLEEALQQGSKVWIETNNDSYAGIPLHLDSEFIEILALSVSEDEEFDEMMYKRTTWLIRLSSIEAVAYPTEQWSKDRLETLLTEPTSDREELG